MTFEESDIKAQEFIKPLYNPELVTWSKAAWENVFKEEGESFYRVFIRNAHVLKLSMSVITTEELNALSNLLSDEIVVDLGAGTGYYSKLLSNYGVIIDAIDNFSNTDICGSGPTDTFTTIIDKDFNDIKINDYSAFILSWPDYESNHAHSLLTKLSKGQYLYYLGEGRGGCCATYGFFKELNDHFEYQEEKSDLLNEYHIRFNDIHDHWAVYKKI